MAIRVVLVGVLVGWFLLLGSRAIAQSKVSSSAPALIPLPVSMQVGAGTFKLTKNTTLMADTPESNRIAHLFQAYVQQKFGIKLTILPKALGHNFIQFETAKNPTLSAEAYQLRVTPDRVVVKGAGPGLFYGLQSLMQLFPLDGTPTIPAVTVEDSPRFAHRGLMLDVARYMMPVSFIKELLNQMAYYKLNQLHWHLTDDQGWRLEIKKYPKLTQIGAFRDETIIGHPLDRKTPIFDGIRHGGFYTQAEAREIVRYAADRHITVIPEIEMPGHAVAAIAAYPELGCQNPPTRVSTTWGVHNDVYCPNEQTFRFLEDVLTEVIDVFPSTYIHIGGDECPKDRWKESPFCQELIKREGLKDEHGLQSWFIQRIEKFVNSKGRKIIGWDEILEGGLAPNATVMSWQGEKGGIEAARQGHDVIMTPVSHLYIDYYQSKDKAQEPKTIGGYVPLEKVYGYDPVPTVLTDKEKTFVKGVQVNMWTEYAATPDKVNYMLYPRLLALAEVAWSPLTRKNLTDFTHNRLPVHLNRLEQGGIVYRVPTPLGIDADTLTGSDLTVVMQPPVNNARLYYTLDGSEPGEAATLYTKPVRVRLQSGQQLFLKTMTVTPRNRRSIITKTLMMNATAYGTN